MTLQQKDATPICSSHVPNAVPEEALHIAGTGNRERFEGAAHAAAVRDKGIGVWHLRAKGTEIIEKCVGLSARYVVSAFYGGLGGASTGEDFCACNSRCRFLGMD